MEYSKILYIANGFSGPYGLRANFLGDENRMSVGVGGDNRSYTRIIVLEGSFPGWEKLADVSTKISNSTRINRVTFNIIPIPEENPQKRYALGCFFNKKGSNRF